MTGYIVFAHGSRIDEANESVRAVARRLSEACGQPVEAAFLELAEPDLARAAVRLVERGATAGVVLPYFLTLGTHMQRDLPRLLHAAAEASALPLQATPPMDGHPALLEVLLDRARAVAV